MTHNKQRLSVLDGIRGFAIILVFLNHIPTTYLTQIIPPMYINWFVAEGVTGVTFLFILSGFLMSYIYPSPSSWLAFVQKRYTRIFPLFLTMCSVMFFYSLYPQAFWPSLLIITLGIAGIVYLLWVYVFKKLPVTVKKSLFGGFFVTQVLIGVLYSFWIMRHPEMFHQQMPEVVKQTVVYLVNATLTLPLGNYVPLLDGVYWSLIAEVLFYIMYPVFFAPVVGYVKKMSRVLQSLFILSLVLFIGSIHVLFGHIALLSMLQPALWVYFVVGIILAQIVREKDSLVQKFAGIWSGRFYVVPLLLFLTALVLEKYLGNISSDVVDPWIRIIFAFPLGILFLIALDRRTILAKLFNQKLLILLGTISYSIYLSHSLVIHLVERLIIPTSLRQEFIFFLLASGMTIGVASILYFLLERPYFQRNQAKKTEVLASKQRIQPSSVLTGGSIIFLLTVFWVYQSQFNFFSQVYPISLSQRGIISLKEYPTITFNFISSADNIGIITARFLHTELKVPTDQRLLFSLHEKETQKKIASQEYSLDYFNSHELFPFGFPVIQDAKGKEFSGVFQLQSPNIPDVAQLDTSSLYAVHMVNKADMLINPLRAKDFLFAKFMTVVSNTEARFVLLVGSPFILLSGHILYKRKNM